LPELNVAAIKAKVDTGARSSSLHAYEVIEFQREGQPWVRFQIHPRQRSTSATITAEAPLLEYRRVKSSGGHETIRPVIVTDVEMLGQRFPVELTLASRDAMGFRMLLGRQAVRRRFLVAAGRAYVGGRPPST